MTEHSYFHRMLDRAVLIVCEGQSGETTHFPGELLDEWQNGITPWTAYLIQREFARLWEEAA